VSLGSDAWRTFITHFDHRGVGRTVGLLAKLMDAQGETESIYAFPQRMLSNYQDINGDEFMVSGKILAVGTLFNLNNKLSRARVIIIVALDAKQNDLAATYIPFTQLSTMLIWHHSHTTFPSHHHRG
jgi:hypothetical protein